jgi:hypothetical protein
MNYNAEYKSLLDSELLLPGIVEPGKMFGYPAYYVKGKLAICHYNDNLIIKLPADTVTALVQSDKNASREGPKPRRNMGKEWVFLHVPSYEILVTYVPMCKQSISFVTANT